MAIAEAPSELRSEDLAELPYNVTRRVSFHAGWWGVLRGESQGRAVQDVVEDLNADGYRVAFVVSDRYNILRWFFESLLATITLGFIWRPPNLLIIGEPIPDDR